MICEACKEIKFRKMIEESKEAMKRYTNKLKEENKCRIQANKKATGLKEK